MKTAPSDVAEPVLASYADVASTPTLDSSDSMEKGQDSGRGKGVIPTMPTPPNLSDAVINQEQLKEFADQLYGAASTVSITLGKIPPERLKWTGIAFFAVGAALNFVSYSYAAQSLLAAIASIQFVSNVFFGYVVLRERVTARVRVATGIIVFGNVFVVACASRKASPYTAAQLLELYDYRFRTFGLCMIGLVIFLHIIYSYYRERERLGNPLPHSALVVPILYSCVAAMVGTQSVVQAKCLSTLIHASWAGDNQLGHLFTYVVLFLFLGGTFFWLYRVNKALSSFDGLFIIPVLQAFFVIWTIIVGGVYFKEFEDFTFARMSGFVLGVMIVVVGVFLLAPPPRSAASHNNTNLDHEQNDAIPLLSIKNAGSDGALSSDDDSNEIQNFHHASYANKLRAASQQEAQRQSDYPEQVGQVGQVFAPRSRSSRNNWGLDKAPRPDIPILITPLDGTLFKMASFMTPGGMDDHVATPARLVFRFVNSFLAVLLCCTTYNDQLRCFNYG